MEHLLKKVTTIKGCVKCNFSLYNHIHHPFLCLYIVKKAIISARFEDFIFLKIEICAFVQKMDKEPLMFNIFFPIDYGKNK